MKRYCQTLDLYDDKELIEAYVAEHAHVWEEVKAGIREVGIVDMQIYIYGNRLFMIWIRRTSLIWNVTMPDLLRCLVRRNGRSICPSIRRCCRDSLLRKNGN